MESRPTLEDRAAIIDLLTEFTACLDERRWDDLPDVFTPDGGIQFGDHGIKGPVALKTLPKQDLTKYHLTQHMVSNHVVRVNGNAATLRASTLGTHLIEPGHPGKVAIVGGGYDCELVRVDGDWKFAIIKPQYLWFVGEPLLH